MTDPTAAARTLIDPRAVTAAIPPNAAATLCDGLAGTALMHACLSRTDPRHADAAAAHWEQAARSPQRPADGIHTGPGALAASLIIGTPYLPHPAPYRDTTRRATRWLAARAITLAREHHPDGTPWATYDAIRGLAGIGRALLAADTTGYRDEAAPGLNAALTALTTLILTPHSSTRPGWWLSAGQHPQTVNAAPSGAATTGLAHGIAGPLALLATATTHDVTVPRQHRAVHTAATWLTTWREPAGTWPPNITGHELDDRRATPRRGRRHAWCYGTPGIAAALTLAGHALHDTALTTIGRTAMDQLATLPEWDTDGPTLCHGTAGVLQTAHRTGSNAARAAQLTSTQAAQLPGLLTGAAGTALALASHHSLIPNHTPWDSLLLLS